MNKKLTQSGFTIIELLVVVSIIATLASIVTASMSVYVQRAKISKFKQDLIQIRTGLAIYRLQTGAWPPNIISLNNIASALKNANIYGSDTVQIPDTITNTAIGVGEKYGGDVGCGGPESWHTAEYVFYFAYPNSGLSSIGNYIVSQFPAKYHGATSYGSTYRCFDFY